MRMNVKFGFSNSIYEKSCLPIDEIIDRGKRIGYDGLELNPDALPSELDIPMIRKALDENGFEIAAIGTKNAYVKYNSYLASSVKGKYEFVIKYIKDCCKVAMELNCSIVQAGIALQGSKLDEDKNTARERLVNGLKKICEITSQYDLMIILEPLNRFLGQLLNTFDEVFEIINMLGVPNIGLMGDLFHMNIEERSIEGSIRKAGGLLKYLHVNDSNRLAPGEGHLNFVEIFRALKAISYDGYLTLEITPKPTPDEALTKALTYLKKLKEQMEI